MGPPGLGGGQVREGAQGRRNWGLFMVVVNIEQQKAALAAVTMHQHIDCVMGARMRSKEC